MNSALRIWHPFSNSAMDPLPLQVERAEGVYLYTDDGRKILDAISSWWVNLHGHGHPRIAAAIAEQARKLEQVILAGFTHDAANELASRLRKWLPAELTHLFFSDDGSTAVEVALKIAVQHFSNQQRGKKSEIVALEHGYHGDTVGAMSVSADSPFTAAFEALRLPVLRIRNANELEQLLNERKEEIAAMIVEPLVQGAGGMLTYPPSELERFSALCRLHEVLFIADEVF